MASTNFINECKNRANGNRLGKILVDSQEITNSDNLQNFSIDSGCYVDENIIGSVYVKCLKGQFLAVPDNVDLINKSVRAQIGVKYDDTATEYIEVGKYTIERPKDEITANMSQITAYDSLYTNLDSKYICNIDYSTGNKTVSDLYVDVCNQLELTPVSTTFINSTVPITDNPFTNGEKNRTVLQTVAKIASSFIDIDNNTDKIDLCWLSQSEEPDYVFHMNDYASVEGGKIVCGPINCLIIKNSQIDDENVSIKDEESIALHGEHSITISEDYVLYNAELRQQAINTIWNRVRGMTYVDCKLTTYYGKPFLKLGDKIRVYTSETDYFDTYVLKHQFTYDGTFTSVIESPVLTEQEIKTKQDISLSKKLYDTQIEVNKQKHEIIAMVKETEENTNSITVLEKNMPIIFTEGKKLLLNNSAGKDLIELLINGKSYQQVTENSPSPQTPSQIQSVKTEYEEYKDSNILSLYVGKGKRNYYLDSDNLSVFSSADMNSIEYLENYDSYKKVIHFKQKVEWTRFTNISSDLKVKKDDKVTIYVICKSNTENSFYFGKSIDFSGSYINLKKVKDYENGYTLYKCSDVAKKDDAVVSLHIRANGELYLAKFKLVINEEENYVDTWCNAVEDNTENAKIVNIDLQDNELNSLSNSLYDELNVKESNVYLTKRIAKKVLDGSENWVLNNRFIGDFVGFHINGGLIDKKQVENTLSLCTHSKQLELATNVENEGYMFTTDNFIFGIEKTKLETADVASFKKWLKKQYDENKAVTLYYESKNEEIFNLGECNISTLKDECHIELVDTIETTMSCKYYKNSYITDYFSTKTDTSAQIKIASDSILNEVSQTNQNLTNVTTETNNIKIDLDKITQNYEKIGGNNKIHDSVGRFNSSEYWTNSENGDFSQGYNQNLVGRTESASEICVRNGKKTTTSKNIVNLIQDKQLFLTYKLSNDENTTTTIRLVGNTVLYENVVTEAVELKEFEFSFIPNTSALTLEIESITTQIGFGKISDLMLADSKVWEQAQGETWSRTLEMNEFGQLIRASDVKTGIFMGAEGIGIYELNSNNNLGNKVGNLDKTGLLTNKIECTEVIQGNLINTNVTLNSKQIYCRYIRGDST